MDRYTALRVFRAIAERGSLIEAGRRLSLSASAVSKNLAELEADLGVRLVHRTTRRMALTEEGRLYLEAVSAALDALEEAGQAVSPEGGEPSGLLRVSAPLTVTLTWLSRTIPSFLAKHPALRLDLHLDDRRAARLCTHRPQARLAEPRDAPARPHPQSHAPRSGGPMSVSTEQPTI